MAHKISDNWYEDFFQGINCEFWERAIPPEVTAQEIDFVIDALNLKQGQHVLDIPCGFGRHSLGLARKGFQVTGVDISQTFMDSFREVISSEKLSANAIQADILAMQLPEKYDGAICLGNSFGYFTMDKMKIFVGKVSSALAAGGRFIINSGMIAESILPNLANYATHNVYAIGNISMEVANHYEVQDSFITSTLLYTKEGKTEEHSFKHYVFTLAEVKRLLKSYGMNTIATYGSIEKTEYKLGNQIYIVAEKE